MNCIKCNQELSEDARICPNCGEKTEFAGILQEDPEIPVIATEPDPIQASGSIGSTNKATGFWNKMSKKAKIVSILAVCIVLFASHSLLTYRDSDGYNVFGYDEKGYDLEGFDKHGYNETGYNRAGYDKGGYDELGWNEQDINQDTGTKYDSDGYDKDGYDADGYNYDGFNKQGINKDTGTEYDATGNDINGNKKPNATVDVGTNGSVLEYADDSISTDEATRLANYLTNLGWGDDNSNPVSALLWKDGKIYKLEVSIKSGLEQDEDTIAAFRGLATDIGQQVFYGAECDILLHSSSGAFLRTVVGY